MYTTTSSSLKESNPSDKASSAGKKDVEFATAIALAGGYGTYQKCLVFKVLPICVASIFCTNTIPYVLPAIVCDFSISKYQQGFLIAAVYLGMVIGGFIWGYVSDIIGRRKTLIIILASTTTFEFLSSFSLVYWFLWICKVSSGFTTCGFLTTTFTYTSEFVDNRNKDVMTMRTGSSVAFGFFAQPLLASFIIPLSFRVVIIPNWIFLKSWKVFLQVCSLMPFTGLLFAIFLLEESPAYLLQAGHAEKSLKVLKKIYTTNTGKSPDSFPVRELKLSMKKGKQDEQKKSESILSHIRPLLHYPYVIPVSLTFLAQAITLAAFNAVKPHTPMLFALSLGIGQTEVNRRNISADNIPFCTLFETQAIFLAKVSCVQDTISLDPRLYYCSAIVGFCIFLSLFFFKVLIDRFGKVIIFVLAHMISALCMVIFPFAIAIYTLILMSIFQVSMQNCVTISIGLVTGRVPPEMRGLSVGLIMVCGRLGIILGSQIIPWISNMSCTLSFWAITLLHLTIVPLMIIYSRQPNPFDDKERRNSHEAEAIQSLAEPAHPR